MENSSGKPTHFGKTARSIQYSNLIFNEKGYKIKMFRAEIFLSHEDHI